MAIVDRKCQWCRKPFKARSADVRRGWALFCSKRCKAMKQEKRTGQYRKLVDSGADTRRYDALPEWERHERDHQRAMDESQAGWDAHKDFF